MASGTGMLKFDRRSIGVPTFHLKYGSDVQDVLVPDKNFVGTLEARTVSGAKEPGETIRSALAAPLGAPHLADIARGRQKVAIVASDVTRPAPTAAMVGPLLDELNRAGVSDEDVTVVFATGIHRRQTPAEHATLLGSSHGRVRCVDSAGADGADKGLTLVGRTTRGTPVWVDSVVAEADIRIATGNVEYHYFAGYSGGAKALVPGVCGKATIEHNHSFMVRPTAAAGRIHDNPVRLDLEEAGELIGIDFCLNTVQNSKRAIIEAFAGMPNAVLRQAAMTVDEVYGVPLQAQADIVIASAGGYPKDINVYQAQKALDNARFAVRPGGTLILVAECAEGLGERTFESWMVAAESPGALVERIQREFVLGGHKAAAMAMVIQNVRVMLVSALPEGIIRQMFMEPAGTVQEALDRALLDRGHDASVLVLPSAGSIVPRLVS